MTDNDHCGNVWTASDVVSRLLIILGVTLSMQLGCDGGRIHPGGAKPDGKRQQPVTASTPVNHGPAVAASANEAQLLEAVFRQLFEFHTHSLQWKRANLFFVGIGDFRHSLKDPDAVILNSLTTPGAKVLPHSASSFDVQRGVRHRTTDELGLLFYAEAPWTRGDEAFVRAGYVEHGKSGMRFLLFLRRTDGVWRVVDVGPTAVS